MGGSEELKIWSTHKRGILRCYELLFHALCFLTPSVDLYPFILNFVRGELLRKDVSSVRKVYLQSCLVPLSEIPRREERRMDEPDFDGQSPPLIVPDRGYLDSFYNGRMVVVKVTLPCFSPQFQENERKRDCLETCPILLTPNLTTPRDVLKKVYEALRLNFSSLDLGMKGVDGGGEGSCRFGLFVRREQSSIFLSSTSSSSNSPPTTWFQDDYLISSEGINFSLLSSDYLESVCLEDEGVLPVVCKLLVPCSDDDSISIQATHLQQQQHQPSVSPIIYSTTTSSEIENEEEDTQVSSLDDSSKFGFMIEEEEDEEDIDFLTNQRIICDNQPSISSSSCSSSFQLSMEFLTLLESFFLGRSGCYQSEFEAFCYFILRSLDQFPLLDVENQECRRRLSPSMYGYFSTTPSLFLNHPHSQGNGKMRSRKTRLCVQKSHLSTLIWRRVMKESGSSSSSSMINCNLVSISSDCQRRKLFEGIFQLFQNQQISIPIEEDEKEVWWNEIFLSQLNGLALMKGSYQSPSLSRFRDQQEQHQLPFYSGGPLTYSHQHQGVVIVSSTSPTIFASQCSEMASQYLRREREERYGGEDDEEMKSGDDDNSSKFFKALFKTSFYSSLVREGGFEYDLRIFPIGPFSPPIIQVESQIVDISREVIKEMRDEEEVIRVGKEVMRHHVQTHFPSSSTFFINSNPNNDTEGEFDPLPQNMFGKRNRNEKKKSCGGYLMFEENDESKSEMEDGFIPSDIWSSHGGNQGWISTPTIISLDGEKVSFLRMGDLFPLVTIPLVWVRGWGSNG